MHPHGLALARVLLEAGADPNDAQTLYNRMFRPDDSHLELLFEFGLGTGDGGPWKRRLGQAAMGPAEMLAGQLAWAVLHGMDARVELLAAHGVDLDTTLDAFGGAGRTAHEAAVVSGHADTADLLLRLGASPGTLRDDQRLVAAVLAADRAEVERLVAGDPGLLARAQDERRGLVAWAAAHAGPDAVRLAAELGWDVNRRARTDVPLDQEWETGLHHGRGQRRRGGGPIAARARRGPDPEGLPFRRHAARLGRALRQAGDGCTAEGDQRPFWLKCW